MPFEVVRKAKVSKLQAAKVYSVGKLKGMVDMLLPSGTHYGWEFTTHVIGAGDTVPEDHDANAMKFKFKIVDGYDEHMLLDDMRWLIVQGYLPKRLAENINGGNDLDNRDKAPPDSDIGGKMSDAKKCFWVIANAPRKDQATCKTTDDYCKLYDKLNKTDA